MSPTAQPAPPLARDWLVRLRWAATLGQGAAVAFAVIALHAELRAAPVAGILLATGLSNLALARSARPAAIPAALVLDLALLTGLLALTGGVGNPFSALYLLQVALAAVLLGPAWTWRVATLAILGFALLFPFTSEHVVHVGMARAHLWGMWAAFALTSVGIAWFVARLAATLRAREEELARLRRAAELQERVVSLAALAAGTAHELGSPLASIAVSARELELMASELPDPAIAEEARGIRAQVERCREVVGRLTRRAGAPQAEPAEDVALSERWAELRRALPTRDAARITWETGLDLRLRTPPRALSDVLDSLLRNALLAGPGPVRVRAAVQGGALRLMVEDQGVGIPAALADRVGEPFFTTRPAGHGMGLGLFLARRYAEGQGGRLELDSIEGRGTRITLVLPVPSEEA